MPAEGEGSEMTPHRFITSQSSSPVLRENMHKVGKINKANRLANRLWQNAGLTPDEPPPAGLCGGLLHPATLRALCFS